MGNTLPARGSTRRFSAMPWKDTQKMNQKIEFAMKSLTTAQLPATLPGAWDQRQDRLQMERALYQQRA